MITNHTYGTFFALGLALFFIGGTQRVYSQMVINEIHYDPDIKTEAVEFIELYNNSDTQQDLSGWRISGAVDFTLPPDTTVAAHGYLVVAQNPDALLAKLGAQSLGPWIGKLNNDGDSIVLRNVVDEKMDEVDYQLGFPWPTVGDAPGYSIELINPDFDNSLGGNWRASYTEGAVSTTSTTLIPKNSDWLYRKGTSEASDPTTLWRDFDFDDSEWLSGQAPIGYGEPGHVLTELSDMRYNYTGIFLRQIFIVDDPQAVTELRIDASYDDGFKLWINGVNLLNLNISTEELPITQTAGSALDDRAYQSSYIQNPASFLVEGINIVAVQAHNVSLNNSSDFWFDASLSSVSSPPSHGPTPGMRNSAYAANAAPQIRKVDHSPNQPQAGEAVVVAAKVTDPDGVSSVQLSYQLVDPGSYISISDAAYETNWTTVDMNDNGTNGTNGDELAGDSIFSATLPANLQTHRRLVRYRITATDAQDAAVQAPFSDDPQPNFAYFCYDGVPAWEASIMPRAAQPKQFGTNVMNRLPAIHLLSKNTDVENCTWFERYTGDLYKWEGTLVYDGKVYDHIRYRARGGVWRYAMTKNMWKFDFNRGHDFQMRDNYGKKYDAKWTKLNLGACIQQGNFGHRGEQGMFESVGSKLFSLAGVESFNTAFLQLRIVDDVQEAPSDQYEGDFWGLYLAIEQENGRFLDEHDLPDGNLYKMEGGSGELNNLNPLGPTDKSDLNYILNNYNSASDAWWQDNWNLESYYSYQTIVQAIHHYDINDNKNFFYYNNPETGLWQVVPWDLDLTWANNMYSPPWGGLNALASRILQADSNGTDLILPGDSRPIFRMQFRNRIREIRDLLYNADQAGQVIDEQANLLRDPGGGLSFLDADRFMWDYNPKMDNNYTYSSSTGKAGIGLFYQWPYASGVSNSFEGCVQLMKNYVSERGALLDILASDTAIPHKPTITYTGPDGYPLNGLSFNCSEFGDPQGSNTFAAIEWRAGEVLDPSAPAYDLGTEPPYEIEAKWDSGTQTNYSNTVTIPISALKIGRAYRVRVRMQDTSGRWSHWSEPEQFITTESDTAADLAAHLRISEIMYNAAEDGDFDFVELHNSSTNQTLDLSGAAFTTGIDYTFPDGSTLAPNGYLLLIETTNANAFRVHYTLAPKIQIAGTFGGGLANSGETLTLKTAPGGTEIASFEYNDGRHWPLAADGAGHSLIPLATEGQSIGALDDPSNWRASAVVGGSPGSADPEPQITLLLSEIVAHTDYVNPARPEYDSDDWIEIINASANLVDLTDWYLSDDPANPAKWPCPAITLPAGDRHVFNEVDDFHNPITSGFGLDKAGEQVLLSYLPGTTDDHVADAIGFKGQENERSLSRIGNYWYATARSREVINTAPTEGLRISEIMYFPAPLGFNDNTSAEFIEIHNPTSADITLQTVGEAWRIEGGVEYIFPENTVVSAGSSLVLVGFDPADTVQSNAFVSTYGIESPIHMFGPWSGKLGNKSERATLVRPQAPDFVGDSYSWVVEDEIVYGSLAPWADAAGNGKSLTRRRFSQSGLDPYNWAASAPSPERTAPSAFSDQDSDGMSDYDEWLCGTDPTDLDSIFTATGSLSNIDGTNAFAIRWLSAPDRRYSILWSTNLLYTFKLLEADLEYPQDAYTNFLHSAEPQGFYKIEVELK